MSVRYTSDGKRKSSMTHAKHAYLCSCGLIVHGNGGKSSHRRACPGHWCTWTELQLARRAAYEVTR